MPPAGHLSVAFTGFLERIRQILFSPRPPTVDIAFAPQGNDQRIVTYTEQQRPVAFAPAPPSTTFQEVPMRLSRQGVERYEPGPTTTPPIDPALWLASFDGGLTWVAATVAGGQPTWLVAGPAVASPPAGATKLPDVEWLVPAVKFDNAPETIIRDESFDADQQPPAIYLTG